MSLLRKDRIALVGHNLELRAGFGRLDGCFLLLTLEELRSRKKFHQYTIKGTKEKKTYILQHLSSGYTLSGLGLVHAIANSDELSVDVLETGPQRLFDRLLDLLLDETSSERTEGLVQEVVLRIADGELERVNLDVDIVHFEDRGFVLG